MIKKIEPRKMERLEKQLHGDLSPTANASYYDETCVEENSMIDIANTTGIEGVLIRKQNLIKKAFELEISSGIYFNDDNDDNNFE
jgi:hypothetical protein